MKTKELTDDQVNLICATFMVTSYRVEFKTSTKQYVTDNWCNSLDGLVPIWEKLKLHHFTLDGKIDRPEKVLYFDHEFKGKGNTFQQAAAHCTALAILEIKPELKELL